ncbi:MAG: apolipoprotein N-acyltransferase, partial [Rhodobacter sp.]|nr:apolipoprotein N-acyltransferase [Rhodobacter sp.]
MFALPGFAARRAMPSAVLSGALAGLGQAPVSLPWATLVGLGFLFLIWSHAERRKAAFWIGWAGGAGYFAATLFWIVEPFFVDIARHGWMAPFALVFTAGGFALFWGAGSALAYWLRRGPWSAGLAWAVALALMELTRSYLLTGFPWALVGHVWVGWAPMQLAAWIGPHGLTLLTLLLPPLVLLSWWRARPSVSIPLAVAAGLYGAGLWQAAQPVPDGFDRPVLRLIQPNAAQHLKWDPDHALEFFERQLDYTAAPSPVRPHLIIWPETAVPAVLNRARVALERVAEAAGSVPVVLGIQRLDGERAYNSLIVLGENGQLTDLYDKHHLVPFGEYLPFGDLLGRIGITAFSARQGFGYSPGPGAQLLDLGPLGRALPRAEGGNADPAQEIAEGQVFAERHQVVL